MCPKRDSNSHVLRHWFLRPTRLPLRHRGLYHIRQAFYFPQVRNCILFNPTLAVWVPEDMIFCSPSWNRTTNISLEVRSYIHLTNRPLYLRRDLNPYGQCPQHFKCYVSTDSTTKVYYKDKEKKLFGKTFFVYCICIVFFCIVCMN